MGNLNWFKVLSHQNRSNLEKKCIYYKEYVFPKKQCLYYYFFKSFWGGYGVFLCVYYFFFSLFPLSCSFPFSSLNFCCLCIFCLNIFSMHHTYIVNLILHCYLDLVCRERAKIDHACCTILFQFKIKYCLN